MGEESSLTLSNTTSIWWYTGPIIRGDPYFELIELSSMNKVSLDFLL